MTEAGDPNRLTDDERTAFLDMLSDCHGLLKTQLIIAAWTARQDYGRKAHPVEYDFDPETLRDVCEAIVIKMPRDWFSPEFISQLHTDSEPK